MPGGSAPDSCARCSGGFLAWRVKSGPDCEVFFPQTHVPGEQGQSDFTDMRELEVVIAGEPFAHLLYHFVLTYSNWESVSICPSESFEALSAGMQTAFWRLGGVPIEHRTDNLSAATHELAESRGRKFTERYRELIDHYGLRASRNFPGNAHENGDVESANGRLKNAIDQRLRLRGSRAFASREAYEGFLDSLRTGAQCHPRRTDRRGTTCICGRCRCGHCPSYRESYATVSRASAVRVLKHCYSVSSRLIGHRLRVRLHADIVELHHRGERVAVMDRIIGSGKHRIDYRHIIHTLVRKPGAFRRYVFREALFPSLDFRRAYDALVAEGADQADLDYVRILHLAASDGEECVRIVLAALLAAGDDPDLRGGPRAKCAVERVPEGMPYLNITPPDLERLRSAPGREHRGGVRMSAATIARDETLELRLKALRLPSFLEQYHRTCGARSRRRLEPRAISRRTGDPGSRAIAPTGASRGYCSRRSCRKTSRWPPST